MPIDNNQLKIDIALLYKDIEIIKNNHLSHIQSEIECIKQQLHEYRNESKKDFQWIRNGIIGGGIGVIILQIILKFF